MCTDRDLECLSVAVFDLRRFGAATRPSRPCGGITVELRDLHAVTPTLARALASQLSGLEAMLL